MGVFGGVAFGEGLGELLDVVAETGYAANVQEQALARQCVTRHLQNALSKLTRVAGCLGCSTPLMNP